VLDPHKPLLIPAGADSLDAIGLPAPAKGAAPASRSELEVGPFEARAGRYAASVGAVCPLTPEDSAEAEEEQKAAASASGGRTPAAGGGGGGADAPGTPAASLVAPGTPAVFSDDAARLAPEPAIDQLRAAQAEELARYVRDQERRLRLEAKAAAGGGGSGGGS
jgi:hypothetical protein